MRLAPHSRGFSLLELLVVIVIIALFAATVMLSAGVVPEDRELDRHVERLAALLRFASEEALLQGREYGLRIRPHGYEFLVYDQFADQWQSIVDDELFRARDVGPQLEFALRLEDRELLLKAVDPPATAPRPHILVMSSGQLSPFELRLQREQTDNVRTLIGEADGTVRIEADDDDGRG